MSTNVNGTMQPAISTRVLRPLLDAGDALRGRLRTWADAMAANCWENVAYVRRMVGEDVAPREVQPVGS